MTSDQSPLISRPLTSGWCPVTTRHLSGGESSTECRHVQRHPAAVTVRWRRTVVGGRLAAHRAARGVAQCSAVWCGTVRHGAVWCGARAQSPPVSHFSRLAEAGGEAQAPAHYLPLQWTVRHRASDGGEAERAAAL